ncbi:MAG TPA: Uma2 family endonuclease [Caulobacterales bacterium]|nr:Uma2 family endonuclease [Caulobacterales bacterium]
MAADDLTIARFSDAEFERMLGRGAFADMRVELRAGVLRRMNAQYAPHLRIKSDLGAELREAVQRAGLALEVSIDGSVGFGAGFTPSPDVIVWTPSDVDTILPGADVALIVEVADTTLSDDLGAKLFSYARAGVPEYWVADVAGRVIHQCWAPGAAGYGGRRVIPFGQDVAAEALKGVALPKALARWAA